MAADKYTLVGVDGNAFSVVGYTRKAMRETGFSKVEIEDYSNIVFHSNYDSLLSKSIDIIIECNNRILGKKKESEDRIKEDSKKASPKELLDDDFLEKWLDPIFDKYVPASGKADTVGGELIRAFARIRYRWMNDGDYAGYGYGRETVYPACAYISDQFSELSSIADCLFLIRDEEEYEKQLNILFNAIKNYLDSNPNVFVKENNIDFMEDYVCEDEEDDDEDDDDWDDEEYDDEDDWDEYEG